MATHIRRYVFLDFETLKQIKFKKLEKVCDKVFVFVGSDIEQIPFVLVKDIQRMGSNVKWIEVGGASLHDLNYHICFLMGKLHEKISSDVEFAILSNDNAFDPLVNFINSTGRSCIRVRQQGMEKDPPLREDSFGHYEHSIEKENGLKLEPQVEETVELISRLYGERSSEVAASGEGTGDPKLIDETAKETVRRLIRSGNRPIDLNLLKNYILLHNQELSVHGNVEKIIKRLEETNEIKLNREQVIYNF